MLKMLSHESRIKGNDISIEDIQKEIDSGLVKIVETLDLRSNLDEYCNMIRFGFEHNLPSFIGVCDGRLTVNIKRIKAFLCEADSKAITTITGYLGVLEDALVTLDVLTNIYHIPIVNLTKFRMNIAECINYAHISPINVPNAYTLIFQARKQNLVLMPANVGYGLMKQN